MCLHLLGIYQPTLRKCILLIQIIKGKKSKIPMPRHFLNGRSQPVAKSWLPVIYQLICQLSTSKICMSLKVEVFQPISLCPLSNIYHETPGRKHLKILAQKAVVTVSSAPRKT